MKKYFLLSAISLFSMAAVLSCTDTITDPVQVEDNDTYSVAYDITANFAYNSTTSTYEIAKQFNTPLYDSDVVLIYRKSGTTTNGAAIWQQIPRTLYLTQGELDYDFDFSKYDILIKAGGTYNLSTTPEYLNGQTFRVVIVPASKGNKNAAVDYSDYNSVAAYLGIKEGNVKTL